jgi:hypothetical protein
MDPQFQRSFIPKKPITATPQVSSSTISLFSLLSTILFIIVLALAGGVFFYNNLLQKQIDTDKTSLDRAKGAFEPDLINQIIRLDSRIEIGKQLVNSHIAVTPLFNFLSTVTLKSVRFSDFTFTYLAADKILVSMKGQAQSYAAVALESDKLNAQKQLKNTLLSDMTLEPQGTVSFSVITTIDPTLLSYSASIAPTGVTASTGTTTNTLKQ